MLWKTPKDLLSEHAQAALSHTTGTCVSGHILWSVYSAHLMQAACFLLTEIREGGAKASEKQAAGAGCQKHPASQKSVPAAPGSIYAEGTPGNRLESI